MNRVHLHGCRAEPLLSYLAGLGVVRLVAEQLDPEVSARWDSDHLVIAGSELDDAKLVEFFSEDYRPTPLIAPWNGRGGFQDGMERPSEKIVQKVERGNSDRLEPYRSAIAAARDIWEVARSHQLLKEGKVPSNRKAQFVELCRARLPDDALSWLDATVVLLDDAIAFPLILGGAGGVMGSLDASFAFLKYLDASGLLDEQEGAPARGSSKQEYRQSLLRHALFRDGDVGLVRDSSGQFDPGGVGGPNSSSTGVGNELANPLSFVLGMEGAMVFASAASRRLSAESYVGARTASMPFTVAATAAAYGSVSTAEDPRGELWAPLWRDELSFREIRHVMSEGRSQWGRGQARTGLDFVRATATLGVDRSIDEFVRYLVSVRHGQNVLAVPIGRFRVRDRARPEADLLRQLDGWVGKARSNRAPAAVRSALNAVEREQFAVSTFGGAARLQTVLAVLAEAEQSASRSAKYRQDRRLEPISGLSAGEWVPTLNDDSVEFRIAVGLASLRDRMSAGRPTAAEAVGGSLLTLLRPVVRTRFGLGWAKGGPRVPNLGHRPLFDVLNDVVGARAALACSARSRIEASDQVAGLPFAFDYGLGVGLADIGRLLHGQVNEERLGAILSGLLLLEWKDSFNVIGNGLAVADDPVARLHAASEPTYVVLAPFFAGRLPVAPTDVEPRPNRSIAVHPRPEWVGAVRTGHAHAAARSAARLLRGRGWRLIVDSFERSNVERGRLAAALLLHLGRVDGDLRQIRFLLNHQCTVGTRWVASRESQESSNEQT
ncbi:type I-U CRISPR-associated protein Csx17 [Candidatus Poriferisodalis sp.]|uniref:type I-G CRISPR-associated protein Cas8g1/Csx17 n=1 Tax=Candidatus Poriferisodalis sp. TaxID=3101277 RepID=UPI003B012456